MDTTTGSGRLPLLSDAQLRVIAAENKAIPGRLLNGAEVLGRLWREGIRCATGTGWGRICVCAEPTDFCTAKKRWVELLLQGGPEDSIHLNGEEPYFVIEAMTDKMFQATELTIEISHDFLKPIKYGKKGTFYQTFIDIVDCGPNYSDERNDAWREVTRLQGFGFAGAVKEEAF